MPATAEEVAVSHDEPSPYSGPEWTTGSPETEQERAALVDRVHRDADARWKTHFRRIDADPYLDPRRRAAYQDKTLVGVAELTQPGMLGLSPHRISTARGGRRTGAGGKPVRRRRGPHPSVFPPPARVLKFIYGNPVYLWYWGEVVYWAERRGLNLLDLDTGKLIKMRNRSGRPRLPRTSRTKVNRAGGPKEST